MSRTVKRVLAWALVLACLGVVALAVYKIQHARAVVDRIHDGMEIREAYAILGTPKRLQSGGDFVWFQGTYYYAKWPYRLTFSSERDSNGCDRVADVTVESDFCPELQWSF
jgi:hypothetical protein